MNTPINSENEDVQIFRRPADKDDVGDEGRGGEEDGFGGPRGHTITRFDERSEVYLDKMSKSQVNNDSAHKVDGHTGGSVNQGASTAPVIRGKKKGDSEEMDLGPEDGCVNGGGKYDISTDHGGRDSRLDIIPSEQGYKRLRASESLKTPPLSDLTDTDAGGAKEGASARQTMQQESTALMRLPWEARR